MKSEKDFLQGMWDTVSKLEYEVHQQELAKIENRKLIKQQFTIYAFVVMVFLLFNFVYMALSLDKGFVYVFCFIALFFGYAAETLLSHTIRRNY